MELSPVDSSRRSARLSAFIDLLAVTLSFTAGYLLVSDQSEELHDPWPAFLALCIAISSVWLWMLWSRLSDSETAASWFAVLEECSFALGIGFLVQSLVRYAALPWSLPLPVMLAGTALCAVLISITRPLERKLRRIHVRPHRVLFVGDDPTCQAVSEYWITTSKNRIEVLGFLSDPREAPPDAGTPGFLGPATDLLVAVRRYHPDRIVVGPGDWPNLLPPGDLLACLFSGIPVVDAASTHQKALQRVAVAKLKPEQILFGDGYWPKRQNLALQAIYSNLIGMVALLCAAPFLFLLSVIIKATDLDENVFERAICVGFDRVPFTRFRFRTRGRAPRGGLSKMGRWLIRLRLDGLPQVFNVLRGEMAVVGPSPERVEFNEALCKRIPYYSYRCCVKPGVTGWAQIHLRTKATDDLLRLEYDLYYIKNLSPDLDLRVIISWLFGSWTERRLSS